MITETQNISPSLFFKRYDDVSPVRRWTKKEYHKLAELGFFDNMRVEFIDGEIIVNTDFEIVRKGDEIIMVMNNSHAVAIRLILAVLRKIFDENFLIDSQLPLNFGDEAEPEPDIAVILGSPRDFIESHPQNASLIIEVSDTTLSYDRNRKASLYARFGIADYWIVNLKKRMLEIYRQPIEDEDAFYGFAFAEKFTFDETSKVSPLAKPDAKIKVADLLP